MKTLFALFGTLLIIGVNACHDQQLTDPTELRGKIVLRNGTSFGMCAGYCLRELRIDSTNILYTKRSWGRGASALPDSLLADTIATDRWLGLQQAAAKVATAFSTMDTIIGCPDCADGGAEWIEIEQNGTVRRVTFEYGEQLPEVQPLLNLVRQIRMKFEE